MWINYKNFPGCSVSCFINQQSSVNSSNKYVLNTYIVIQLLGSKLG